MEQLFKARSYTRINGFHLPPNKQYELDNIIRTAAHSNSVIGISTEVGKRTPHGSTARRKKQTKELAFFGDSLYVDKRKFLYEMLKHDEFLRAMDKAALLYNVKDVWLLLKTIRIEGAIFI